MFSLWDPHSRIGLVESVSDWAELLKLKQPRASLNQNEFDHYFLWLFQRYVIPPNPIFTEYLSLLSYPGLKILHLGGT